MGPLRNHRNEAFAKGLAAGKSAVESYKAAGYQACRQNASRLSSRDDVRQRVVELKTKAAAPPDMNGRHDETGQFLKGYSRGGRPLGSRNKLSERFLADLHAEWERSGTVVLQRVAKNDPTSFMKVVAGILPKELDTTLNLNVGLFAEIRDFSEAFKLARQVIGADDAPLLLIDAEVE